MDITELAMKKNNQWRFFRKLLKQFGNIKKEEPSDLEGKSIEKIIYLQT